MTPANIKRVTFDGTDQTFTALVGCKCGRDFLYKFTCGEAELKKDIVYHRDTIARNYAEKYAPQKCPQCIAANK